MTATYTQVGQAAVVAIQGLGLPGVDGDDVLLIELPTEREAVIGAIASRRVVTVTLGQDQEEQIDADSLASYWRLPLLVTFEEAQDESERWAWDDDRRSAREMVLNAFDLKNPLASVVGVYRCQVRPRTVLDPGLFRDQKLAVGQLVILVDYKRDRL